MINYMIEILKSNAKIEIFFRLLSEFTEFLKTIKYRVRTKFVKIILIKKMDFRTNLLEQC